MSAVKVSVITPSYNSSRFIEETILSVKNQTYSPIEHIVMDGGSTDATLDILRRYEGTYDLRWWSEPDRGQSHAFNKGIGEATGEWLYFLNSDDYLLDDHSIGRVVAYIEHHPGYSIYMGKIWTVDAEGRILGKNESPFKYEVYPHGTSVNQCQPPLMHQAVFYKRSVFETVGLYFEEFKVHMDYEFHLRASRCFDIAMMGIPVACLRRHLGAKSMQRNPERYIELFRAWRMHGGRLWHRNNLYFLKEYLASASWSGAFFRCVQQSELVQGVAQRLGLKGLRMR